MFVVAHGFAKCLTDSSGNTAVKLALDDRRVDDQPGVVDPNELDEVRLAGPCVELDDRYVGS